MPATGAGQHLFGSGQRAEQVVIRMLSEEGLDLFAVLVELLLERAQELAQAQRSWLLAWTTGEEPTTDRPARKYPGACWRSRAARDGEYAGTFPSAAGPP